MDTRELNGLELRKALCRELDWSLIEDDNGYFYLHHEGSRVEGTGYFNSPDSDWHDFLPAIESDPGVFWPEFEKWLRLVNSTSPRQIYAGMQVYLDGRAWFQILHNDDGTELANEEGATICEAGCRAWLKALEAV